MPQVLLTMFVIRITPEMIHFGQISNFVIDAGCPIHARPLRMSGIPQISVKGAQFVALHLAAGP